VRGPGAGPRAGARDLHVFVGMLRTTPVERPGSGRGAVRSPGRINHVLAAVRELYCHAVAAGELDAGVLGLLFEIGDDRFLPAELKPEGSGLRYRARPRHVQRVRRRPRPASVSHGEVEELLRCCRSWRDRFLLVLLWFGGLRIGEALGLRRSDLHLAGGSARALGCAVPGPHLHVVARDGNPNGARAKSGDRHVPLRTEVLACYDHYLAEREACPEAAACDFMLVNLFHEPLGRPMSDHTVRRWLAVTSRRAGLDRLVRPHMFRHATATELLARGAGIDVVKELLGHFSGDERPSLTVSSGASARRFCRTFCLPCATWPFVQHTAVEGCREVVACRADRHARLLDGGRRRLGAGSGCRRLSAAPASRDRSGRGHYPHLCRRPGVLPGLV
jgi:integrase